MKTYKLNAEVRVKEGEKFAKKCNKALRAEKKIPAILYGGGGEALPIAVKEDDVRNLIYTPDIFEIDLNVDGKEHKAVMKDLQFQPVKDTVLHIDFLEVFPGKPIVMEVPVRVEGHAEGVRAGGKLQLVMRKLKVKAPYTEIPERLVVNVDKLGLGQSLAVGDLHFEGLELVNAKNAVVCAVQLTRAARGAAAKAEE